MDFSARRPGSDDWSNLPEVEATDRMPPTDAAVATDGLRGDGVTGPTVRLFLTFVAAVDKMRDATQLCRAAGELFRTNPEVFDPAVVSSMSFETLSETALRQPRDPVPRTASPGLADDCRESRRRERSGVPGGGFGLWRCHGIAQGRQESR